MELEEEEEEALKTWYSSNMDKRSESTDTNERAKSVKNSRGKFVISGVQVSIL